VPPACKHSGISFALLLILNQIAFPVGLPRTVFFRDGMDIFVKHFLVGFRICSHFKS